MFERRANPTPVRPLRVSMLDLFSIVPYYTAELTAALKRRPGLTVELGAITYYLDPDCYRRLALNIAPGVINVVSRAKGLPPLARKALKTIEYGGNLANVWRRSLTNPPDIVHIQFLPLALFGSPVELGFINGLRRRGVKIVYTAHNLLPHEAGQSRERLYRRFYESADRLICHDENARLALTRDFGQGRQRIDVIPHGPLLQSKSPVNPVAARSRLGLPRDIPLVLWQGILRPYKGVGFLLESWKLLQQSGVSARLAIVGTGDEQQTREIRERVQALGLADSVQLDFRFISVSDLEAFHSAADILVYPYSEVTTSGALMTGAGYGKAVVASRAPAFAQILEDGQNALLATYGNAGELAGCLNRLIGDAPLRTRLGQALQRTCAAGPAWDDIAAKTEECYRCTMN